ncbi:MAG: hypothetical protein NT007_03825 [Candidatus Kapabacteria bacterium]|nr:hypothetical protein [Candidatus Kapabacteria bacterium]
MTNKKISSDGSESSDDLRLAADSNSGPLILLYSSQMKFKVFISTFLSVNR